MAGLVDSRGNPISASDFARPRKQTSDNPYVSKPGEEIAPGWNAEQKRYGYTIPFGNQLTFNTNKLTLADYRMMREHYQINSSLSILSFMIHQMDWRISGDKKKIEDHVDANLRAIWPSLVRAMSQAFWSGYSPTATQWENQGDKVILTKIKDLPPEECEVRWKSVKATPVGGTDDPVKRTPIDQPQEGTLIQIREKMNKSGASSAKIFDGITQAGYGHIPVGNSFWYPCLMEYGNYYGKKLLNTAYQPWFFSLLIHMYSNRYFERFGEPVPVARAPYDEEIDVNGNSVKGHKLMQTLARQFRNGSAVVLPNNRVMNGTQDTDMFEYSLEFLESQMRGADFDRYMQRLDEEISLSLFTPILLNRTGSGGSFNLGVTHMQLFQWQVNAIVSDMVGYINKFIIRPMVRMNFGEKTEVPQMVFRSQGRTDPETLRAVILELVRGGKAKPDINELGDALGLKLEEIKEITEPPADPNDTGNPDNSDNPDDPAASKSGPKNGNGTRDNRSGRPERSARPKGSEKRGKLAAGISDRVSAQYRAGNEVPDIGHWNKFRSLMMEEFSLDWEDESIGEYYADMCSLIESLYANCMGVGERMSVFKSVIVDAVKNTLERADENYVSENNDGAEAKDEK